LDELLGRAAGAPPALRSRALRHAPLLWFWEADTGRACALATEGLGLSRALDDAEGEAFALGYLGYARLAPGDEPASVRRLMEEALATARRAESRVAAYTALFGLARALAADGDHEQAVVVDRECLALQRAQGDHAFLAITLSRHAQSLIRLGALPEARAALDESFGLHRMVGRNQSFVSLLDPLVELTLAEQQFARAMQLDAAAEVFAFVRAIPRWHVDTVRVEVLAGDGSGVGSRVLDVIRTTRGQQLRAVIEITRHEPDRLWAFSADLDALGGFEGGYRFESTPAGTRVIFTEDLHLRGWRRLLKPLVLRGIRRSARQNLAQLRLLLEAPESTRPSVGRQ
jgi:tetratricopeptide (TPR) repeat protein